MAPSVRSPVRLALVLAAGVAAAACSTGPCPLIQGVYSVGGSCSGPEVCPLTQCACSGTLVCRTSGLACSGEVDSQGNATFSCGGALGMAVCTGSRAGNGVISLACMPSGGSCTITLTPLGDAG